MINIIPKPNKIVELEGSIDLHQTIKIIKELKTDKAILFLKRYFKVIETTDTNTADIIFVFDNNFKYIDGSYKLAIENKIVITAKSERGFLYAVESMRQMLNEEIEDNNYFNNCEVITLPQCIIEDYPRYIYRGLMLDSCRHFFKKEYVLKKLDEMALLKLNKFHFHLSDDQGWRIDLPNYPKLKEISSVRARTKIDGLNTKSIYDVYENKPYRGIYTIDDLKDIVAYAANLCIDVIPEIDSPGHLSALLAAYPEYSCKGHDIKVEEGAGIYPNLVCLGNDEAVNFMFKIIDEIADIFPSHHFHIGGDEAPLTALNNCPKCKSKMKQLGFKSVLELKLAYSNKLAKHLISKGYQVTGWNEIVNNGYPKDAYIQLWSPMHTSKTIKAVNNGQKVIDSSFFDFYLDYAFSLNTLKRRYFHNPESLFNKEGCKNVIGVESCLWTEWVRDEKRADWQIYPKLCATAEIGWSENNQKNYNDFLQRVEIFNKRLNKLNTYHTLKECYLKRKKKSTIFYFIAKKCPANTEYNKYNK